MNHTAAHEPRFDLQFVAGEGTLSLAQPLSAGPGTVRELELCFGRVALPYDVSEGPRAFRHRRAQVRRASVSLNAKDLGEIARSLGVEMTVVPGEVAGRFVIGVRDEFGIVAANARVLPDGPDLLVALDQVRCVVDGPATPWSRLLRVAGQLELEFESTRGLFRLSSPAKRLLLEALATRGWRLPATDHAQAEVPRLVDGEVLLEWGTVDAMEPPTDGAEARHELARAASVVGPLLRDEVAHAALALESLEQAMGERSETAGADPQLLRLRVACAVERPGDEARVLEEVAELEDGDPFKQAILTRVAIRQGDPGGAASAAALLSRSETVPELVAEALGRAAELLAEEDPAAALSLVSQAAARRPHDAELTLLHVHLARRAGDLAAVEAAFQRVLAGSWASSDRAAVAAAAAESFVDAGLHERAERAFKEAILATPGEPMLLVGLGELHAIKGGVMEAVALLDRAADAWEGAGDRRQAASAFVRAGELLESVGKHSASEHRLERACECVPDRPEYHCRLGRVRWAMQAPDAARVAYDHLLRLEGRPDDELADGLAEAARFYAEQLRLPQGAAPFVDALGRIRREDPRLSGLRRLTGQDLP